MVAIFAAGKRLATQIPIISNTMHCFYILEACEKLLALSEYNGINIKERATDVFSSSDSTSLWEWNLRVMVITKL